MLDLKGAYPSVRRCRMMEEVRMKLPRTVSVMISVLIKPDRIRTAGDDTGREETLKVGLPEGTPSAPHCSTDSRIS